MNPAEHLVVNSTDLVSLPTVVLRVAEMLTGDYSAAEIGAAVAQDPALTVRLLKIVNSPYYGFSGRVDTVTRAVSLVGVDVLYALILTTTVVRGFKHIPASLVNMDDFWLHSLCCGEIARLLAKEARVLHGERLFIAGLLHRVGSLVLYMKLPEQARQVLEIAGGDERLWPGLERTLIGCDHVEVGAELAKSWRLPPGLCAAIRWQLQPTQAEDYRMEASLVYLANRLRAVYLLGTPLEEALDEEARTVLADTGLVEARILNALAALPEKLENSASLFLSDRHATWS